MQSKKNELLIVLGSSSDKTILASGLEVLEANAINFSLRIASAHRTPRHLESILSEFNNNNGKAVICVAGMSAHLAGVVASLYEKPVIAVPVYRKETAGFDSLLSMSQMPRGIPVATMGFGSHGFCNAVLFYMQMLAISDNAYVKKTSEYRYAQEKKVIADDMNNKV